MIKAVICDLDGLLADTEKLHLGAYKEALARFGVSLSDNEYIEHWVRNGDGIATYIERNNLPLSPTEVRAVKVARYRELVQAEAEPMPGAVSFLRRLKDCKRLALGSSSYRADIELVMKQTGIDGFFEVVVSADDVRRVKPAPDIFARAAQTLRIEPGECVVIEDAQKGIEAAHSAGMKSIAVPNIYTRSDDFSRATCVVQDLDQITATLIDSLE